MYPLSVIEDEAGPAAFWAMMESVSFQALSLLVVGFYLWMLYFFRRQVASGMNNVAKTNRRTGFRTSDGSRGGQKQRYDAFQFVSMTLLALAIGIATVKGTILMAALSANDMAIRMTDALFSAFPDAEEALPIAVLAVALVAVCIALLQTGVLKAAGSLTLAEDFTDEVVQIKKRCLVALSLLFVPLVPMVSGWNPVKDRVIIYIAATVVIAVALMFAALTLGVFIKQKVSLLVWFLYLCTVEIFPVGAIVLLTVKNV